MGIEVKASASIKRDHFAHLKWFNEKMVQPGQSFVGIILYTGDKVVPFSDNLYAVPLGCLF